MTWTEAFVMFGLGFMVVAVGGIIAWCAVRVQQHLAASSARR